MSGRSSPAGRRFRTTQWSMVEAAGGGLTPESRQALEQLCQDYWPPVYAYIRRRGNDAEAARELTQGFFTDLLARRTLGRVQREGGKFRSFLLTCAKYFLSNEWDRSRAKKRGGGNPAVCMDLEDEDALGGALPRDPATPELVFERRWALSVLAGALDRVEEEMENAGRGERFRRLRPILTGDDEDTSYEDLAAQLSMTRGALKVAVHRLRRRFGRVLREEVGRTVADPDDVEDELRFLLSAMHSR